MDLCNIFRNELLVLFKEEQYVDEFRFITGRSQSPSGRCDARIPGVVIGGGVRVVFIRTIMLQLLFVRDQKLC